MDGLLSIHTKASFWWLTTAGLAFIWYWNYTLSNLGLLQTCNAIITELYFSHSAVAFESGQWISDPSIGFPSICHGCLFVCFVEWPLISLKTFAHMCIYRIICSIEFFSFPVTAVKAHRDLNDHDRWIQQSYMDTMSPSPLESCQLKEGQ